MADEVIKVLDKYGYYLDAEIINGVPTPKFSKVE
jgi:hypothetical protein